MSNQIEAIIVNSKKGIGKNRILSIFCTNGELIKVLCSIDNKSNLQLFETAYIEIDFDKSFPTIIQHEILYSRRILREDFERLAYSSFISELVETLLIGHNSFKEYTLVSKTFDFLMIRNPRVAALCSSLKISEYAGYKLPLYFCIICEKKLDINSYIDTIQGYACNTCTANTNSIRKNGPLKLLKKLQNLNWDNYEPFTIPKHTLKEAENLFYSFINHHLTSPLNSLKFLKSI